MAAILKPFANLLAPGKLQVPTGQLAIDWTHSLTRSLIACYVPGVMGGVDVSGSGPALFYTGGTDFLASTAPVLTPDGAATKGSWKSFEPVPQPFSTNSVGMTLFWRGMLAGNSNAFDMVMGVNFNDPNTTPFNNWILSSDGTGLQSKTSVFWNTGGAQATTLTFNAPLVINKMESYAATMPVNGTCFCYRNGQVDPAHPAGTSYGINPPTTTATTVLYVGSALNLYTNIAIFWNRALSADEMQAMHLDPYGFLIPAEYELPLVFLPPIPPVLFAQVMM